jgi:hypothetical protein
MENRSAALRSKGERRQTHHRGVAAFYRCTRTVVGGVGGTAFQPLTRGSPDDNSGAVSLDSTFRKGGELKL